VPNQDVVRRFYRSKDLFCSIYKDIVSSWSIYYNSDEIFEKIADDKLVFDVEKYNKFKENSPYK